MTDPQSLRYRLQPLDGLHPVIKRNTERCGRPVVERILSRSALQEKLSLSSPLDNLNGLQETDCTQTSFGSFPLFVPKFVMTESFWHVIKSVTGFFACAIRGTNRQVTVNIHESFSRCTLRMLIRFCHVGSLVRGFGCERVVLFFLLPGSTVWPTPALILFCRVFMKCKICTQASWPASDPARLRTFDERVLVGERTKTLFRIFI